MRIALTVLTALLAGCMTVGNTQIEDPDLVRKITPGKTTKAEVRALAGAPSEVTFSDTGEETWKYTLMKGQTRAASFVPVVGIFVGGMDLQTYTLTVRFRQDGIVGQVGSGVTVGGAGGVQD